MQQHNHLCGRLIVKYDMRVMHSMLQHAGKARVVTLDACDSVQLLVNSRLQPTVRCSLHCVSMSGLHPCCFHQHSPGPTVKSSANTDDANPTPGPNGDDLSQLLLLRRGWHPASDGVRHAAHTSALLRPTSRPPVKVTDAGSVMAALQHQDAHMTHVCKLTTRSTAAADIGQLQCQKRRNSAMRVHTAVHGHVQAPASCPLACS
jgi:hypothetical protein